MTYVENAVWNGRLLLQADGRTLKSTAKLPFASATYRPEIDTSDECNADWALRYSQLIGVRRWPVELGQIDMYTDVSLLSQHLALPWVGHLEVLYCINAYLHKHEKLSIIFDPRIRSQLHQQQEQNPIGHCFYDNREEELPPRMPGLLGNSVSK